MLCVIQTTPGRSVRNFRGPSAKIATKYVKVRADNKFEFMANLESATVFESVPEAIQAIGRRAQQVNKITDELTIAEVEKGYVAPTPPPQMLTVKKVLNGSKVHPEANGYAAPRRGW